MNLQKIQQLHDDNRAARLYFAVHATRRRSLSQTSVQDVVDLARRQGVLLAPSEVETFFQGLEEADCGHYLKDSDGWRFMWLLKSTQVARAAQQKHAPIAAVAETSTNVTHTLRLRPDWTLTLELPPDFSLDEAQRVGHFLLALPISASQEITEPQQQSTAQ
jgi:hypothetical protein